MYHLIYVRCEAIDELGHQLFSGKLIAMQTGKKEEYMHFINPTWTALRTTT